MKKSPISYFSQPPHLYVPGDGFYYNGCDTCGYGPGTYFHNEFLVARMADELLCFQAAMLRWEPTKWRNDAHED